SAVMASASAPKVKPMSGITARIQIDNGEDDRPSAHATMRMARPDRNALLVAHSSSASATSSRVIGAFMIASQVRCTCMREKPEYIASKVALFMVEKHTVPAAMNTM